jgi:type I restriction enzyme R subunit
MFMRDIKSRVYFEQMKGRGTRTISSTDLNAVTPDTQHKTHFVVVDAVGVCESDKTEMRPLERKKSVPFDKLILSVAAGNRDEDTLSSLAGRLARMENEIDDKDKEEIKEVAKGMSLKQMVNGLLDAIDPDKQMEKAKELFKTESPTALQMEKATEELVKSSCLPFDSPDVRGTIIDIKRRSEQTIDVVSPDELLHAGADAKANEKAHAIVESFRKFIEENKNQITALQILYSKRYGERHLTYEDVKQLADAIRKPPYQLTPEMLWHAYQQLERARVRGAGPQKLLTNIISLVRFAIGQADALEPFTDTVNGRFKKWLSRQEGLGREFTKEQIDWLTMIKDHIATSLTVGVDDLEYVPFAEKGGPVKAFQVFGKELDKVLSELSTELVG